MHETTQNLSSYTYIILLSRVSFKFSYLEIWTTATRSRKAGDPGRGDSGKTGTYSPRWEPLSSQLLHTQQEEMHSWFCKLRPRTLGETLLLPRHYTSIISNRTLNAHSYLIPTDKQSFHSYQSFFCSRTTQLFQMQRTADCRVPRPKWHSQRDPTLQTPATLWRRGWGGDVRCQRVSSAGDSKVAQQLSTIRIPKQA